MRLSRKQVRALLKAAQPQPKIIEAMNRPIEKVLALVGVPARFLTPERIDDGVQFWNEHKESLERIAAQCQVTPEYIVGILGVETSYGRNLGRYRVLDALATLAFDYPARRAYFRSELEQFLILTQGEPARSAHARGLLRRRHGCAAVHALELPPLRGGCQRGFGSVTCGRTGMTSSRAWRTISREHGWTARRPGARRDHPGTDPSFQIEPRNLELQRDGGEPRRARREGEHSTLPPDTPAVLLSAEHATGIPIASASTIST